jgi:hypothetical protein
LGEQNFGPQQMPDACRCKSNVQLYTGIGWLQGIILIVWSFTLCYLDMGLVKPQLLDSVWSATFESPHLCQSLSG